MTHTAQQPWGAAVVPHLRRELHGVVGRRGVAVLGVLALLGGLAEHVVRQPQQPRPVHTDAHQRLPVPHLHTDTRRQWRQQESKEREGGGCPPSSYLLLVEDEVVRVEGRHLGRLARRHADQVLRVLHTSQTSSNREQRLA